MLETQTKKVVHSASVERVLRVLENTAKDQKSFRWKFVKFACQHVKTTKNMTRSLKVGFLAPPLRQ